MKLTPNWKSIITGGSFSFWGNVLIAVASGIAGGFAYDGTFYWSMALANGAVAILRLIYQKAVIDDN